MNCPKCHGLVVNPIGEPYCLNCGNRPTLRLEAAMQAARESNPTLCLYCHNEPRITGNRMGKSCLMRDRSIRVKDGIRAGREEVDV